MKSRKVMVIAAMAVLVAGFDYAMQDTAEARGLGHVRRSSRHAARHVVRAPVAAPVARGVAHRTAHRTTRRVVRRHLVTLPVAHTTAVVLGVTHYIVDSVHYVRQMEAGKVIYVVVE